MRMERVQDALWKTYTEINGWIRFSDTKAGVMIATNGTILSIVFSKSIDNANFIINNGIIFLSLVFGFLFGLLSIYFAIRCLNPTLEVGEPRSLIYFAHIAKRYTSPNEYNVGVLRGFRDELDATNQISNQVWANSKVAWNKYINVTRATRLLIGAIASFIVAGFDLIYQYGVCLH